MINFLFQTSLQLSSSGVLLSADDESFLSVKKNDSAFSSTTPLLSTFYIFFLPTTTTLYYFIHLSYPSSTANSSIKMYTHWQSSLLLLAIPGGAPPLAIYVMVWYASRKKEARNN